MATYVRTVTVYVDNVDSPAEADEAIIQANDELMITVMLDARVEIRLPDSDNEYQWEEISDTDPLPGESPDPNWMND